MRHIYLTHPSWFNIFTMSIQHSIDDHSFNIDSTCASFFNGSCKYKYIYKSNKKIGIVTSHLISIGSTLEI